MPKEYIQQILAALLIFLFVYAAISKLSDIPFLRAQLSLYPYIKGAAGALTFLIPFSELVISALLLFPATRYTGFRSSLVLLILFTGYLVIMISTRSDLPCSCGGVISRLSWREHIGLNLFFMTAALTGSRLERSRKKRHPEALHREPLYRGRLR